MYSMPDVKFAAGEIVVEVNSPRNDNRFYKPLGIVLRSQWSRVQQQGSPLRSELTPNIANMPDVAGLLLCLDVKNRRFRLIDPLGHMEDREQRLKEIGAKTGRAGVGARPDEVFKDLKNNSVATHWYWMRRMVEGGNGILHRGEFGQKPKGRVVLDESKIAQHPDFRYDPTTGKGLPRYLDEKEHQDSLYDDENELVPVGKG